MAKKAKTAKKTAKASGNGKSRAQDAVALLKADHRTVEDLFEKFENAKDGSAKQKIANQVCMELIIHAQVEEEIFYPGVKDAVEEAIYTEAHVEHDGAKVLISEILAGSADDEFYDASVHVLSEMIKHHVKEEEQRDGMFAQAKAGDVDLAALGEQLAARKAELMAQYKAEGPPALVTRTMKEMPNLELGEPVAS